MPANPQFLLTVRTQPCRLDHLVMLDLPMEHPILGAQNLEIPSELISKLLQTLSLQRKSRSGMVMSFALPAWTPIISYLFLLLLSIFTVGFTDRMSRLRHLATICVIVLSFPAQKVFGVLFDNATFKASGTAFMIPQLLNVIDVLVFSRCSWDEHSQSVCGRKSVSKGKAETENDRSGDTKWNRFWYGCAMMIDFRRIGSKGEIPYVPPFPKTSDAPYPSRKRFLLRQAYVLFASFIFADFCHSVVSSANPQHYSRRKEYFLSRIHLLSTDELKSIIRTECGFIFGFAAIVQMSYSGCALLFVGLGITKVATWRPCLGSLEDLYTVRHAWG
jgi:hypothetical protein